MPTMNRKTFFDMIRRDLCKGRLTIGQVEGFNSLLDAWIGRYHKQTGIPQFAVCLATAFHETAATMKPIREIGNNAYFTRLYGIEGQNPNRAILNGNRLPGDGPKYCGRGLVQLTWHVNYDRATKRLRELGIIGPSVDFTVSPNLVMLPQYAIPIMFIGMEEGWFTGVTLDSIVDDDISDDLKDEYEDFVRSRRIINGKDRAEKIAGYAIDFLQALRVSVKQATDVAPPKIEAPPPPDVEAPGASLWNRFWSNVAELYAHKK